MPSAPSSRSHVVIVASEVVGRAMAGPGIRAWEFARLLSRHCRVSLAIAPSVQPPGPDTRPDFDAEIRICCDPSELRRLAVEADAIVVLGTMLMAYPFLAEVGTPLVVDFYDPFLLASLGLGSPSRAETTEHYRRAHLLGMRTADFMLCASEPQRDYWLGMASAAGRVNAWTHDDDPLLERLIAVVPFGLPAEPPTHTRPVLKGVHPGIAPSDKVVLWGGGIWDWFDAPTAIRAIGRLSADRPDTKLFFMGLDRPNRAAPRMSATDAALDLARDIGVLDRSVFFNDWVAYDDRQNYLLEADVGISLHRPLLESRLAFRTRFLDYLWAGLPIVATEGDVLGAEVKARGLGTVVAPGDVAGTADAIRTLVDTPTLKARYAPQFAAAAACYRWDVVAAPLVEFCRHPRTAPDKHSLHRVPVNLAPISRWEATKARLWSTQPRGPIRRLAHSVARMMRRP